MTRKWNIPPPLLPRMPLADLRQPERRVGLVLSAALADGHPVQQRRGAQDPVPARGGVGGTRGRGMNPGISAFFGGEDALRLQMRYRDLRERMAEAQRAGDRRAISEIGASIVIFEALYHD